MIREYLSKILSARYGRDVRQAIHDSIQQCYYDGKAGEIDLQARQDIETLNGEVESLKDADNTINENIQALGNAMDESVQALENTMVESFQALGNEVEGLKDADNTINQTLQELGDDVSDLKVSTNDIVETTETTMPNSHEGRLLFKEIRGKTEQGANPSPTNPQEIKSSVVSEIKTYGKNHVNATLENVIHYSTLNNYEIVNNGLKSTGESCLVGFKVKLNSDKPLVLSYVIKFASGDLYCRIREFSKEPMDWVDGFIEQPYSQSYSKSGKYTYDYTPTQGTKWIAVGLYSNATGNAIEDIMLSENGGEYEPYKESAVTLSQPITLDGIGDVQDILVQKNGVWGIGRKFNVVDLATLTWAKVETWYQVTIDDMKYVANNLQLGTALAEKYTIRVASGISHSESGKFAIDTTNIKVKDDSLPSGLLLYELAEPTFEILPTVDQIALNSLKTFDGITYLEFDSPLEPEFVTEYGTSKVGGVALEAKGESQANGENIEEMNSVLEAMNTILQDAFTSRNADNFNRDADLCNKSGAYYCGNWSNTPYANGFLIVFACEPSVLIQINTLWNPEYIAIRANWHGTWWGWRKIPTEAIT